MTTYYGVTEGEFSIFVLRQTRYKADLARGIEHKNDICAYAQSLDEMKAVAEKYFKGDVDYSAVEDTEI